MKNIILSALFLLSFMANSILVDAQQYKFIRKFGSEGTADGQFLQPFDIEVDDSLNIYVTDIQNNNVQIFDSLGNFIKKFGSAGSGKGQFSLPSGIAIDASRNIYVTEGNPNYRVQKFDHNGNYITQWGGGGNANGQFGWARGIATDKKANVYVVDTRLQVFDSSSTFLYKIGPNVDGYVRFLDPEDVVIASDETIVVHDFYYGVQKYDQNGKYLSTFNVPCCNDNGCSVRGIAIDKNDNIFTISQGNACIQKFDKDWKLLTGWGSKGEGNGQFDGANKLTVDRRGYVYVADGSNSRIQIFAPSTIVTSTEKDLFEFSSSMIVNTAKDEITVTTAEEATFRLLTITGQEKHKIQVVGIASVYIGTIPKGIYIGEIASASTSYRKKIVIE